MMSNCLKVIKKKPLILLIIPIMFIIEDISNPIITNMELNPSYNIGRILLVERFVPDYFTSFYVVQRFIALFSLCLTLMIFFKGFFSKKTIDPNNINIKNFFKNIVMFIVIYLFFSFLFILVDNIYTKIYFSDFFYNLQESKGIIEILSRGLFRFIDTWLPSIFVCFILSYSIFCIQSGFNFLDSCKKIIRVIFTKAVFVVILVAFIATWSNFIFDFVNSSNKSELSYTYLNEPSNYFNDLLVNNEKDSENLPVHIYDYETLFKLLEEHTSTSPEDPFPFRPSNNYYSEENGPLSIGYYMPSLDLHERFHVPLYITLLRILLQSIFVSIIFIFSASLLTQPKTPKELKADKVNKEIFEEYTL
ncbi:UNVERIFIED_CONTAM: hypothetical protein Cloal_0326 [Acetivibrio alkalicellulosi]